MLHIARSLHKRTSVAEKQAATAGMLKDAAECVRASLKEQLYYSAATVAASNAEVDVLQQQLETVEAKLRTKEQERNAQQKLLSDLQAKQDLLCSSSDSEVVNICAASLADGSLELHSRFEFPDGLLRRLSSEQQHHLQRLLPGIKAVSLQRSAAGCSFVHGYSSLLSLCAFSSTNCACFTVALSPASRLPRCGSAARERPIR